MGNRPPGMFVHHGLLSLACTEGAGHAVIRPLGAGFCIDVVGMEADGTRLVGANTTAFVVAPGPAWRPRSTGPATQ